ncbi:adenine nucleotide alpha hydrolase [Siminovitchia terrae]|nr:adenine nucleotide alpha hydrolase [Siminovitchia terrae]
MKLKCTIIIDTTIKDVKMMKQIALSWSGGKDSCMALHKLTSTGKKVVCLVTTVPQETGKTFAHNEDMKKIKAQADSLEIPMEFIHCTYDTYTDDFLKELKRLKIKYKLDALAFGDMYLDGHREWGQNLADAAELEAVYPLWSNRSGMLQALKRFVDTGYKAEVIKVREDLLPSNWVGRLLDDHFIKDISEKGICPMGESGEYHTFVYDGPLFNKEVKNITL